MKRPLSRIKLERLRALLDAARQTFEDSEERAAFNKAYWIITLKLGHKE